MKRTILVLISLMFIGVACAAEDTDFDSSLPTTINSLELSGEGPYVEKKPTAQEAAQARQEQKVQKAEEKKAKKLAKLQKQYDKLLKNYNKRYVKLEKKKKQLEELLEEDKGEQE